MIRFLVQRLLAMALTLLGVALVIFFASRLLGDPVALSLPLDTTEAQIQRVRSNLGLDRPYLVQLGLYLKNTAQGDFGNSIWAKQPVSDLIKDRLPNSLTLALAATIFSLIISIPLGVAAAVFRGRLIDKMALVIAVAGMAVPNFWLGIVLIQVFAVNLGWTPAGGTGDWKHFILPTITLGSVFSAGIVRLVRSSMLEVLGEPYVVTARAKGLRGRTVLWGHAFRNALVPLLSFSGVMIGTLATGGIVVETVFAWPGIGQLAFIAVSNRDYPVLQAVIILFAAMIVAVNTLVDVLYAVVDPRIRV